MTQAPIAEPPVRRSTRLRFKLPSRAIGTRGRRLRAAAPADSGVLAVLGTGFAAVLIAEAIVVSGHIVVGEVIHGLTLALLLGGYILWESEPERRLLLALAVLPVVRILSVSLPTLLVPELGWYVLIGVPTFVAIGLAARRLGLSLRDLGIRRTAPGPQLTLAVSGLILGLPAYIILRPEPLTPDPTLLRLTASALVLALFGGVLEELLFRGLIQTVASQSLARGGVVVSTAATAVMYAASLNTRYVFFMVLVAAFFGLGVRRTGSIVGTSAGHAILLYTQLVVWPLVL